MAAETETVRLTYKELENIAKIPIEEEKEEEKEESKQGIFLTWFRMQTFMSHYEIIKQIL